MATHYVVISDEHLFIPHYLEICVGDTVIWKNSSKSTHTVTATDKLFNFKDIKPNDSVKYKFTKDGIFFYDCDYHIGMGGTITVDNYFINMRPE